MPAHTLADYQASLQSAHTQDLHGHKKVVRSLAWNRTGKILASGSVNHSVLLHTIDHRSRDGSTKHVELKGHSASVDHVCWDPTNSELLASASCDKTVRIWDAASGKSLHTIATSGENINLSWSPDGNHIAVANKEDVVSWIDARKWTIVKNTRFTFEVNEISWNKAGDQFFLTTGNGTVEVLRFPALEKLHVLQAHTATIYCIDFDPTRKYFACGGADALVSLWDYEELVCVRTFGRLEWPIRTVSFSHDGQLLASASEDPVIDISHVETGELVYSLPSKYPMNALAWNPKYRLLAYAGDGAKERREDEAMVKVFGFAN